MAGDSTFGQNSLNFAVKGSKGSNVQFCSKKLEANEFATLDLSNVKSS